jgi:deaminated glutathione amidase
MKLALIQMNSISDRAANLAQAEQLIAQAVAQDQPDWICLPEVFDFMGGTREDKYAAAQPFPESAAYQLMQKLARKHHIFIHAGSMLERRRDDDRLANTSVAFDENGTEVARYSKIHLFDVTTPNGQSYRESAVFAGGHDIVTYQCKGLTIGCAICYDLRFPALFQALMDKGADMIALPAAFTWQTGRDHWHVLCRARAIETQTFFCAAAQTGSFLHQGEERHTYGHSLIVDPWGHVLGDGGQERGHICVDIDVAQIKKVRAMIPIAAHKVQLP